MRQLALAQTANPHMLAGESPKWVIIVHAKVPGRTRFLVRGLHRSPTFATHIIQFLATDASSTILSVSTLTGTLLIKHPTEKNAEMLRAEVERVVCQIYRHQLIDGLRDMNTREQDTINASLPRNTTRRDQLSQHLHAPDEALKQRIPPSTAGSCLDESKPAGHLWFLKSPNEIASELNSNIKLGLEVDEAKRRLLTWGPNIKPLPPVKTNWEFFADQFSNLPSGLLAASSFLSLVTGAALDAFLIAGVLVTNGAIGFATERRTNDLIRSLGASHVGQVPTLRSGMLTIVPSTDLVPGDLIILEPGPIPADIRILEADHLSVDESALTGESTAVAKSAHTLIEIATPLADRNNLLYSGTFILSGHGRGIVIGTGRQTEMGVIEQLVLSLSPPPTPMQENLEKVGQQLVMASLAACAGLFVLGIIRGLRGMDLLKTAVSLAVASVPEGLPTVGTTTLALGIGDMQKKSVFVRHLAAVENLGAVSVICFDKTGTLTLNKMTVTDILTAVAHYSLEDGTILRNGCPITTNIAKNGIFPSSMLDLYPIARVSVLCNDAELVPHSSQKNLDKQVKKKPSSFQKSKKNQSIDHVKKSTTSKKNEILDTYGSPTEKALLAYAKSIGLDPFDLRHQFPRIRTTYRSESARFMITWHQTHNHQVYIAIKGSPEDVLPLCSTFLEEDQIRPMTDVARNTFLAENQRLAGHALRVLALAEKVLPINQVAVDSSSPEKKLSPSDDSLGGLLWLGLVGLKDPPRAGVGPVLEAFHTAGILTNMVTGDQESTAQAIGRDLGMNGTGSSDRLPIFSRVSPSDKLKIIRSLQSQGHVVAMTGDGVNDSPALRAADVGIAMGEGAGAAIAASEVVLGQSNLETMLEAVRLGRTIRENLGKAVHFLIATNLSELMVSFMGVMFGNSHLLSPKQLLWINLLTDIFPAIGLAFEASEPMIMQRPPLSREASLFEKDEWRIIGIEATMMSLASLIAYGLSWIDKRDSQDASTAAFSSLAFSQLLHAMGARHKKVTIFSSSTEHPMESNLWLRRAVTCGFLAQIMTVALPQLRSILGNSKLDLRGWTIATACGIAPFLLSQLTLSIANDKVIFDDHITRRNHYVIQRP